MTFVPLDTVSNRDRRMRRAATPTPIVLTARMPIAPSVPVPLRTTAIERSRKAAATDSNSRSADGRTKCTSSVWVSETVPSAFTSRWWLDGAT
jgi:hypothetical protein